MMFVYVWTGNLPMSYQWGDDVEPQQFDLFGDEWTDVIPDRMVEKVAKEIAARRPSGPKGPCFLEIRTRRKLKPSFPSKNWLRWEGTIPKANIVGLCWPLAGDLP